MFNNIRARNRQPYNFQDGLFVGGVDISITVRNLVLENIPTKTAIGLGNVDNTSDINKPVSTAQAAAIAAAKAEAIAAGGSGGSVTSAGITTALGYTPMANTSAAIIAALGFTPAATGSGSGTSITSAAIATALGFTPADVTKVPAVGSLAGQVPSSGFVVMSSTGAGTLSYTGNIIATGDVSGNAGSFSMSDERIKTNWREYPTDFVSKLSTVKSGTYDRLDVIGLTQDGVSAQSLAQLLQYSVKENEEGMLSVAYGNAALVSVIEVAKLVIKMQEQISALCDEISVLKNK